MKKKLIRLTESDLTNIIRSSVMRTLNEGATSDSGLMEKWERCIEMLGADCMLNWLWNCMSEDEIRENLEWIDRHEDLGLFDDEIGGGYDDKEDYIGDEMY